MYKFDAWLKSNYPEVIVEYKNSGNGLSLWNWLKENKPEIIKAWQGAAKNQ